MAYEEFTLIGRNAVIEAYRSGKTIDKLYIQDGSQDGPIKTILREAKKQNTIVKFVSRERLDTMSDHGKHQGVVAYAAAMEYAQIDDLFAKAEEKGEDPFFILCDEIEDPHNLGAIIRTANLAGAHGVIIPKRRAAGLTGTVAKVISHQHRPDRKGQVIQCIAHIDPVCGKDIHGLLRQIEAVDDLFRTVARSLDEIRMLQQHLEL